MKCSVVVSVWRGWELGLQTAGLEPAVFQQVGLLSASSETRSMAGWKDRVQGSVSQQPTELNQRGRPIGRWTFLSESCFTLWHHSPLVWEALCLF